MVNKAAMKRAQRRVDERKEERESYKPVRWRRAYAKAKKDKEKVKGKKEPMRVVERPVSSTSLIPWKWRLVLFLHIFKNNKPLKRPIICPIEQYGHRKCDECEGPEVDYGNGRSGPPRPVSVVVYLGYDHELEGETHRMDSGEVIDLEPQSIIEVPQGKDSKWWEKLDEVVEEGVFNKCVIRQTIKDGKFYMHRLSPKAVEALGNKGKIPKSVREMAKELTQDEVWAHILNTYEGVDWEYFGVEEPEVEKPSADESNVRSYKDDDKKKSKRKSRDEDDDDEESDDDEDEDDSDEDDEKPRRKTSGKKSRSKLSRPSDDDEDDSEDDEDDEDDEDEDEKPRKSSKKKSKSRDEDDEDEDMDESIDDDSDDEDDDEDEDERPRKSKKKKKR